ncbi:MAG: HYR domain-containing protein [Saprospiraceae bacterium]
MKTSLLFRPSSLLLLLGAIGNSIFLTAQTPDLSGVAVGSSQKASASFACPVSVDAGPDQYLCNQNPATFLLSATMQGSPRLYYWEDGITQFPKNQTKVPVTVNQTTSYNFVAWALDSTFNLIQNPQFEDGNTAFTSGYDYSPGDLVPFDCYDVLMDPHAANPLFPKCPDHTTGYGLMLATSNSNKGLQIWAQDVPVEPNTMYFISGWATRFTVKGYLRLYINGQLVLSYTAPMNCTWGYFSGFWFNSGISNAHVVIEQPVPIFSPGALAIDDLFMAPMCKEEDSVTVHMTSVHAEADVFNPIHFCDDHEITLNGEGSTEGPFIFYNWTTTNGNIVSGANTLHPVVNAPGTYTLTVTLDDGNYKNCYSTATVETIEGINPFSTWITSNQTLNCVQKQMTLSAATNQGSTLTYQWTASNGGNILSGATTKHAQINAPGTYTLLVTDQGTGCTAVAEREIEADTVPPIANAIGNPITCLLLESALNGTGSTTGLGIHYKWTTPDGLILSGQDSLKAVGGTAGTYVFKVTNSANFCTATDTVVVSANNIPPIAEIGPSGQVSCLMPLIVLTAQQDTGNTHLVYRWTTADGNIVSGEYSPAATVNAAGSYVLTLTNTSNGCVDTDTARVEADTSALLAIANAPAPLTCTAGSVLLNANGSTNYLGLTYLWTTTDGHIVSGENTPAPLVDQPGTYWLVLSNPVSGCTATDLAVVVQNTTPPPVSVLPPMLLSCAVSQQVLQGINTTTTGNFSYQWIAADGGNIVNGANTLQPIIDAPGSYSLLATDLTNGCTSTLAAQVAEDVTVPEIGIASPQVLTCATSMQVLLGQNASPGNFTYQWTATNGGNISSGANTLEPVVDAPGTYSMQATNLTNGCTAAASVQVNYDGEAPNANVVATGLLGCNGVPATLANNTSTNPALLLHSWTIPDGNTVQTGTTPVLQAYQPGTYLLVLTNTQNGCTTTAQATINTYDPVQATLIDQTDASCFGAMDGSLSISAAGGNGSYTYLWDNTSENPTSANLSAGNYTVTVTDGTGCTAVLSETVGQPEPVVPNALATAPMVFGGSDGTASANPSGGTAPYSFAWSGGATKPTIDGLSAGLYTVTVTDSHGCTAEQTVEVWGGACNLAASATSSNPLCFQSADGSATALPLGGTSPFSYQWSNNATEQTAEGLSSGTYTVVVTDANGCQFTTTATLADPAPVEIDLEGVINATCPGIADGAATVLPTGGTGNLTLLWSNGEQGPTAIALTAGLYTVSATDENGCAATLTLSVEAWDLEPPVLQGGPTVLPLGPAGVISLTLLNLGVTVTENCALDDVQIVPSNFDCLQLGTHLVSITAFDEAGNSSVLSIPVTIIDNLPPSLECPPNVQQCFDNPTVQYLAPVATDNCLMLGGHFDLVEGLPSGTPFPVGVTKTTYSFTDASQNTGMCSFTVTILTPIAVTLDNLTHDTGSQGIGSVQITTTGSQPGYTYLWQRNSQPISTSEDLSGVGAGAYTLVVTDSEGCSTTAGPFIVDDLVGTDMPDWAGLVAVFPNPTSGQVQVVLPEMLAGTDVQFVAFDGIGRQVWAHYSGWLKHQTFDWSALNSGLYVLLIRTNHGQAVYRMVVNR